eukprot:1479818-Pleurochrysis_carterae.AAC.3
MPLHAKMGLAGTSKARCTSQVQAFFDATKTVACLYRASIGMRKLMKLARTSIEKDTSAQIVRTHSPCWPASQVNDTLALLRSTATSQFYAAAACTSHRHFTTVQLAGRGHRLHSHE